MIKNFTPIEKAKTEVYLQMTEGHFLDIGKQKLALLVDEVLQIDILTDKYAIKGDSKANRVRAVWELESEYSVGKLLKSFVAYYKGQRISNPIVFNATEEDDQYIEQLADRLMAVGHSHLHVIKPLNDDDMTFAELAESIQKMIQDDKPAQALDRMHTFYVKYIRGLCKIHQISYTDAESLNAVYGKYIGYIEGLNVLDSDMTKSIMKYSINLLDKFNSVRNNQSFAHDNELLNNKESMYIFDTLARLKGFIDDIEERIRFARQKKEQSVLDTWSTDSLSF
ncbi:abortive infection family protein [Myroides pelagicus]|uniref:Abortive infection protein-like C-terminal domain-containing protein n=1 Tax=Myroides pelagicus TaxID=270914 RepID=A0A7K1GLM2_9FLAO|nr:abortive infection family protein [Myroides pelagicus]MTH29716.1 hypothetical protein [Myroides pelagicus]